MMFTGIQEYTLQLGMLLQAHMKCVCTEESGCRACMGIVNDADCGMTEHTTLSKSS